MARPRTIVLGFDGLSMIFLKHAMDKGYMPYLSNNKNKFIFRDMYCIPPLTPPSWTSIMTGVNPGKHGIFHFFKYDWSSAGLKTKPVTALDLEHPRIHETLALAGSDVKSIIVNLVPSYPIIPVKNGRIMSIEFFTPKPLSYPRDMLGKYFSDSDLKTLTSLSEENCESMISLAVKKLELYISLAETILTEDYDLIWLNTHVPDEVFHRCRRSIHKLRLFARIFKFMDLLIKKLDNDSEAFLIVSDHGFRFSLNFININKILFSHGYLSLTKGGYHVNHIKLRSSKTLKIYIPKKIYRIIKQNTFMSLIARNAFQILNKLILRTKTSTILETGYSIDPFNSDALPVYDTFILVRDGNTKKTEELVKLLSKYGITAYKREDLFSGPYVNRSPDIILIYNNSTYPGLGSVYGRDAEKRYIAHHSKFGVFVVKAGEILDQDLINASLPKIVPNTLPTPFVLKLLNSKISHITDNISFLRKLFKDVKLINVVGRWKIYKKLSKRLGKMR